MDHIASLEVNVMENLIASMDLMSLIAATKISLNVIAFEKKNAYALTSTKDAVALTKHQQYKADSFSVPMKQELRLARVARSTYTSLTIYQSVMILVIHDATILLVTLLIIYFSL